MRIKPKRAASGAAAPRSLAACQGYVEPISSYRQRPDPAILLAPEKLPPLDGQQPDIAVEFPFLGMPRVAAGAGR
jgi:hypothetical protein